MEIRQRVQYAEEWLPLLKGAPKFCDLLGLVQHEFGAVRNADVGVVLKLRSSQPIHQGGDSMLLLDDQDPSLLSLETSPEDSPPMRHSSGHLEGAERLSLVRLAREEHHLSRMEKPIDHWRLFRWSVGDERGHRNEPRQIRVILDVHPLAGRLLGSRLRNGTFLFENHENRWNAGSRKSIPTGSVRSDLPMKYGVIVPKLTTVGRGAGALGP
jgi:hypothetical protein